MGPAGLLLTMRAAALRLPALGVDSPAHWLLTGPGRGLEASALPAQCGCWSSAARRCADGPASWTCGRSPGGHVWEILILRRNAMCTHATRRPGGGAAPRPQSSHHARRQRPYHGIQRHPRDCLGSTGRQPERDLIHWPGAPTITTPSRFNAVAAEATKILAHVSTSYAQIRARQRC